MSFVKRISLALVMMATAACAAAQQVHPKPATPRVPMRNLDAMIEKAREDLATRLGGKPAEVTLAGWKPVQLPARVLHCEVAKGDPGEAVVPGFRMVFVYKARDYTYLSDTQTVTACPRIEAN